MRLAIFVDQVFWRDGRVQSTDASYDLFLASFVGLVDKMTLIGREAPGHVRGPRVLDETVFSLCALPYYPDLYRLWRADPRIYRRILRKVREQASTWDPVLISGPNPIGPHWRRFTSATGSDRCGASAAGPSAGQGGPMRDRP